jgi:nicotinic acid mononucleotide adenylyltransferase
MRTKLRVGPDRQIWAGARRTLTGVGGIGVYPGSFDPPTVAHLAIAEAALGQGGLDGVVLALSRVALGKEGRHGATLGDRLAVLRAIAATRPWMDAVVTDGQLIADVASGYDAVIVGADKWAQIMDPAWYGSSSARDAAVAGLPRLLVAPRPPFSPRGVQLLDVPAALVDISSTAVREGRRRWMAPEALAFDDESGAWSDPARYRRWLARASSGRGET